MGINVAKKLLMKAKKEAKRRDKRSLKSRNKRLAKRQAKKLNEIRKPTPSNEKQDLSESQQL